MPISAGPPPDGTRCRGRKPSAARACRWRSTPPAPKSGARRTSPSASARCLTLSAIEALDAHGSEELKKIYLEKLVSGEWTGTMQLTEPKAGSDVGALRTRAERAPDGTYRIKGTKIFITYGDHDMTDNIVHFVLARLPDAPAGTKGISLFLIPKFMVNADGSLGARNDIYPSGVEHKLGMHASPTCTMTMGDKGGAIGYLIGEENRRHALHVHDDEPGPPRRRPRRRRHCRPRLSAGAGLRAGAPPGQRRSARRATAWTRSSCIPTSSACCCRCAA